MMSESSGKYKLAVASHSQMLRNSNQMLRDIHKSLRHLNVREPNVNHPHDIVGNDAFQLQQQLSFEHQLALENNINVLSQSAAGERRSYPRATKQFALEEIRKDVKPCQWRNGTLLHGSGFVLDGSHQNFKSSSYTDLTRNEIEAINSSSHNQQRGYDEAIAPEALRDSGLGTESDMLHPMPNAHNKKMANNSGNRATQNQRLFGVAPHNARPGPNMFNSQTNSRANQITSNRYSGNAIYYMKHGAAHETTHRAVYQPNLAVYDPSRQYSAAANERTSLNCEPHFNQLSLASNYSEPRSSPVYSNPSEIPTSPRKMSADSHNWNVKKHVEQPTVQRHTHYEDVTLRQKSSDRRIPAQNRWSAEVYAIPYDFKPPPPYPGFVKGSQRPTGPDTDLVQVGTNTPITVIFDEKNDRVNVVGGIPEGYEKVHSTSSSSGQSSPRQSLQKYPPEYIFTSSSPQPQYIQPQYIQSPNASQVHPSPSQQSPQIFSTSSHTQPVDITFVPIKEPSRRERGSPPPYPGRYAQIGSNRSSMNLDELETSAGREFQMPQYYSSDSGNSSKRTSTATEPGSFNQSDSSTSASPTPDGVERSYSPLPLCNMLLETADANLCEKVEEKCEEKKEKGGDRFPTRLKNCNPQAYKFFMEQHVENLIKLQEQRKHRRSQLEAEMARVGLAEQAAEEMRKLLNKKESNYNRLRRAKMDISMFTKIVTVGVGAFGEVNLVRKKGTSAYYAMKILRKSEVLRRNQVAHVKAERDILAEADNEWVVKLYYSFQNEHNLYFVMDYVAGGDLMALLIKVGIFEEELARFYISELTLAIESVHKLGFIHRDIKPDNVLIDLDGHIKLTDFGLCTGFHWTHDSKYYQPQSGPEGHSRQFSMEPEGGWESLLNDINCDCKQLKLQNDLYKPLKRRQLRRHIRCQAHSLVGTPNYIAPEVLTRVPYSQQCDWWSVGVILYEMLVGQPPFLAPTPAETQIKVINWCQTLTIPKNQLPKESRDLIRKLCTSPEERLGKEGAEEIKRHQYFKGVNFKEIHRQQAPYVPTIKHATDTSNFDPVPEHMSNDLYPEENMPVEDNNKKDGPEYAFYEFTFRHFFDDGGMANPNFDLSDQEKEKPKPLSHAKRPITTSNKSVAIPSKVPAPSTPEGDEKIPIYV